MFGGFDPGGGPTFFERKRWQSMAGAILLVGGGLGYAFHAATRADEVEVEVEDAVFEGELADFEEEEAVEDEPIEEALEPPPPEPAPDPRPRTSSKPTPTPEIANPDSMDDTPEAGDINSEGGGSGGGGGGLGTKPKPEPEKPEPRPEPEPPKPKPKPKQLNPDKPIERPAEATVPKKIGGDSPVYPAPLKKRNITGKVKVRLVIYKDGSVKGAKVLAKSNSIDKGEKPELYEKANALLLKAVAAAVKTWKFKPSTYEGQPITVYQTITIPFTLT